MKGGKAPLGYTIIEVMIVLAVSGFMFVIAANFINGKQERAAFTQSVTDMASTVQNVIEQINNGQYSDIPLNCLFNGTTTSFGGLTSQQGQNSHGCTFLGKIMHFSEGSGTDYKYEVFSLAGGRLDINSNPITTPNAADPIVIPSLTAQQSTPQQVDVSKITANINSSPQTSFAFGFLQGQGQSDGAHGLQNGPQTLSLYYVPGVTAGMDTGTVTSKIAATDWTTVAAQQIDMCLTDGTQYADLILGTNNNQLSVNFKMYARNKPANIC